MEIQFDNNTPFFKSDGTSNPEFIAITIVLDDSDVISVLDPATNQYTDEEVTITNLEVNSIKVLNGESELEASTEFISTDDKSYESIDPDTGEITIVTSKKDFKIKLILPKNENTEAMVEGTIECDLLTKRLDTISPTQFAEVDYKSSKVNLNFKQEPGLAEVPAAPEVSEDDKGNFIIQLIAMIAFPTLQIILDAVLKSAQETLSDLTAELTECENKLNDPNLSDKAKKKLNKKVDKLKGKVKDATDEVAQATKDASTKVQDEIKNMQENGSCLVKDINKHFNNVAVQNKVLTTGVPKLLQSGITSTIEPMTAITACPVGPAITTTNPSQIMGTLTRLKTQASALNTSVQSLTDSIDFLHLTTFVPGITAPIEPLIGILGTIDKIPG